MAISSPIETKGYLHELIEELPESEVHTALRFLEYLVEAGGVSPEYTLENAPMDDEPLTEDDLTALEEAYADEAAGRIVSNEEAMRQLLGTR